jgi:hypothetical protein
MQFRKVTLTSVGVSGIVPEGWAQAGDGRFNRGAFAGDPTMLYEEAFPHVDLEGVKATMASALGLDAFPERIGTLDTARFTWDLHTFEVQLPHVGTLVADFSLAQDGTWVYFVSLAATPDEHETLYKDVLVPVTHALVPLPDEFGLINGGVPGDRDGPTLAEQLGYSRDSVLAIVHADDMALHRDQTDGALEAMGVGMCKTGSVMVPCPDFDRTLAIWKERPDLDLGIHLTLNSEWGAHYGWRPVLPRSQVPSLYSPEGIMWPTEGELREHVVVAEALHEMEAQILRVLEAGAEPTHVDDHMGCYWQHPDLKRGAMKVQPANEPDPHREDAAAGICRCRRNLDVHIQHLSRGARPEHPHQGVRRLDARAQAGRAPAADPHCAAERRLALQDPDGALSSGRLCVLEQP